MLQYMGFVTVHYHRIESTLEKIPRLWQISPGSTNSTASAAGGESQDDIQLGEGVPERSWAPLRVRASRLMAAALTAASASWGFVLGIRQGYKTTIAIPRIYWQRPGRIVAG
jgi:hypothetical protein